MNIVQFKRSNLAQAPDELAKCINKYSKHTSTVGVDFNSADVVHFHNKFIQVNKKSVMQYHSEPFRCDLNYSGKKLVISQYHATLLEYKDCQIVRNIIDFETPEYEYVVPTKIKIGYSPSTKFRHGEWFDKGYEQTTQILNRIKARYGIEIDIITDVPLDVCIQRKRGCSILIDECVTPSFHRSGLEGLALGRVTICSVGESIEEVLKKSSGAIKNPFNNVSITGLEINLIGLIENGLEPIIYKGKENYNWMREFWHPKTITNEFIKIYEEL